MPPFTPEQEERLRQIVREEMAARFGEPLTHEQEMEVWSELFRSRERDQAAPDGLFVRGDAGPEIEVTGRRREPDV